MEKHSHREYQMWMRHLEEEWNRPSRTDHYLMQIAAKIEGLFRKGSIKISSLLLPFQHKKPEKELTKEQIAKAELERSKAAWRARVGL